tara:strand:+ start:2940 stop:3518 length:579 start_codon:yes stop_codon:yes gene_type:complete
MPPKQLPQIMHTCSETPNSELEPKALLKAIKECFEYYYKQIHNFGVEKARVWKGHKAKVKSVDKYVNTLRKYTKYDTKTIVVVIRYPDYESNQLLEGYDWQVQYCDDIYRRKGMDFDHNELLKWFDHVYCKDIAPAMSDVFGFIANLGKDKFLNYFNSLSSDDRKATKGLMEYAENYGEKRNWSDVFKSMGI